MMGRVVWAVVLVILSLGPACADAFDDFNQGVAANERKDSDTAIAALSRAISASDLSPSLRPAALTSRGMAYYGKKDYPQAISDFSAAIKLKPDDIDEHWYRSKAYHDSGDNASALQDCDALTLTPLLPANVLSWCGKLRWEMANFDEAYVELKHAVQLNPTNAYDLLWFELIRMRAKAADDGSFSEFAASLSNRGWPMPLIDLYLGRESLGDVTADVTARDEQFRRDQSCELGFYGGEWQFLHGDIATARILLEQAAQLCPNSYEELSPAKTELKRLNEGARS